TGAAGSGAAGSGAGAGGEAGASGGKAGTGGPGGHGGAVATLIVLASGQQGPSGIAVDSQSVYWSDSLPVTGDQGAIRKVPIGGGSTPIKLTNTGLNPVVAAVDASWVYYTEVAQGGSVARVPIQGGTSPLPYATGQAAPQGMAVGSTIYWANYGSGEVM